MRKALFVPPSSAPPGVDPFLPPLPSPAGMPRGRKALRAHVAVAALLALVDFAAFPIHPALAGGCTGGAAPAGAAGTSALYGALASNVAAEPLSVDISSMSISGSCTWVYHVKVLTAAGSVALLDFDLKNLDLRRVEGSVDDPEVAELMEQVRSGGNKKSFVGGSESAGKGSGGSGSGSGGGEGGGDSGGSRGSDSGGGEGGSSGGGGGDSGGGEGGGDGDGGGGGGDSGGGEGGGDD